MSRIRPRRPSQIPPADRLRAKDIAQLECISAASARRMIRAGNFGPVYGRNARDRWVDRRAYAAWLDRNLYTTHAKHTP